MEESLRSRSTPSARIAADAIPAVDAYLREQDLFELRCGDVTFDMERRLAALTLGVAARGESFKTGREQGVLIEASYPIRDSAPPLPWAGGGRSRLPHHLFDLLEMVGFGLSRAGVRAPGGPAAYGATHWGQP